MVRLLHRTFRQRESPGTMTTIDEITPTRPEKLWAVLLTLRQRRLLEACVDWHARVHDDPRQRAEFTRLLRVVRDARPVHEMD
jgi:hypothetical protein